MAALGGGYSKHGVGSGFHLRRVSAKAGLVVLAVRWTQGALCGETEHVGSLRTHQSCGEGSTAGAEIEQGHKVSLEPSGAV